MCTLIEIDIQLMFQKDINLETRIVHRQPDAISETRVPSLIYLWNIKLIVLFSEITKRLQSRLLKWWNYISIILFFVVSYLVVNTFILSFSKSVSELFRLTWRQNVVFQTQFRKLRKVIRAYNFPNHPRPYQQWNSAKVDSNLMTVIHPFDDTFGTIKLRRRGTSTNL